MWEINELKQRQADSVLARNANWHAVQAAALQRFIETGLPHRKMEQWKYTNLIALAESQFPRSAAATTAAVTNIDLAKYHAIVFHNGQLISRPQDLPSGVIVTDVQSVLNQKHQFDLPADYQTMFSDLNLSLMSNGIFIRIAKNIELNKPICLVYQVDANSMQHPRHIIHLENHAKATFISHYQTSSDSNAAYFNNVIEQITLEAGAKLNYCKYQNESHHAFHIANFIADVQRDATLRCVHFGNGANVSRDDVNVALQAENANCELYALYQPTERRLIDFHTRIDHNAAHTHSQQLYKTITADKARAVFNGRVIVAPDSQSITAHQKSVNLLLSAHAEVDAKPELEIYADDVKCSHGATIGQMDEQALFYLRSRGLDFATAQTMLKQAFAEEILAKGPQYE